MWKQARSLQTALLVLAIVFATTVNSRDSEADVQLESFTTDSFDSLEAIFKSDGLLFNLTSYLETKPILLRKNEELNLGSEEGIIISTISVVKMGRIDVEQPKILSQIVIPGKYMYERKVPDMEKRIARAAHDMLEVLQSQTPATTTTSDFELVDLVNIYETMISDILNKFDMQNKFNQGRASIIYHTSIARTALRLFQGVPLEDACPAHQAYEHQGLFACQQEYSQHAQRVMSSPLWGCKDSLCVKDLRMSIGHLIEEEIQGLDVEVAGQMVKGILGLGKGNNSKLAEEIARLIACGNATCHEPGCNSWVYTEGWFIYGADWGCCGDYPGCCLLSSEVCLVHDAICTCCSLPSFCLDPFCKPDPWCSDTTTASPHL